MIYLIQVEYKTCTLLKIGYTKDSNKDKRFIAYKLHNPLSEILFTIPGGTEKHEKSLHLLFRQYLYPDYGNEWFVYNEEIIKFFQTHITKESLDENLIILSTNRIKELKKQIKMIVPRLLFCGIVVNNRELISECENEIGNTIYKEEDIFTYLINKYDLDSEKQNKIMVERIGYDYSEETSKIVQEFLDSQFYNTKIFKEKMKMFCEFMDKNKGNLEIINLLYLKIKDPKYKEYYNFYGTSGCRAVRYEEKPLKEGLINLSKEDKLYIVIHSTFKVGDRFTKKYIKSTLSSIYSDLGITYTPKATDLEKYFKLIKTKITMDDKSLENGFKLEEKEPSN